jgi:hypothetical protein
VRDSPLSILYFDTQRYRRRIPGELYVEKKGCLPVQWLQTWVNVALDGQTALDELNNVLKDVGPQ